jgi:hypothetical protein
VPGEAEAEVGLVEDAVPEEVVPEDRDVDGVEVVAPPQAASSTVSVMSMSVVAAPWFLCMICPLLQLP